MKKSNKGFTLVELIVVLVILAILAAILVPALLGYIDKAREKQITTNAEAAYVAAQAIATEQYGKGAAAPNVTAAQIKNLTDITDNFSVNIVYNGETGSTVNEVSTARMAFVISQFTYNSGNGKTAVWQQKGGTDPDGNTVAPGGWYVIDTPASN